MSEELLKDEVAIFLCRGFVTLEEREICVDHHYSLSSIAG